MIIKKLIFTALTTALFLTACQPQDAATLGTTNNQSPVKIGISLPLSGRLSEPGTAARHGYETWAARVVVY
jgi:branched-chain amino acid transport system substrate-binding protein